MINMFWVCKYKNKCRWRGHVGICFAQRHRWNIIL